MKKILLTTMLFLSFTLFASNSYVVTDVKYDPPEFYIGDSVKCTVSIQLSENIELVKPQILPKSRWVNVDLVNVKQKGQFGTIIIFFRPYNFGNHSLPKIDFESIVLKDISYYTSSSLTKNDTVIQQAASQLYLPRTFIYLFVIMLFVALIPMLFFILTGRGTRLRAWIYKMFTKKKPYKIFMKKCAALLDNINSVESKAFYTELTTVFRTYLTSRTGEDFFSVTTGEMNSLLKRHIEDEKTIDDILSIISHSDEIRFSFKIENLRREEKDINRIIEICSEMEKNHQKDGDAHDSIR